TGPGQVVLVGIHCPRVLGGLPTDEGTTGLVTAFGDPTDDLGDPLGHHGAAGDVVGHEQRFGATDHQIVGHHRHQVDTDRVVFVHLLGEHQFRADPVGGGRQDRVPIPGGVQPEKTRETAGVGDLFRATGARDVTLHQVDGTLTRGDVDACGRVRARPCVVGCHANSAHTVSLM